MKKRKTSPLFKLFKPISAVLLLLSLLLCVGCASKEADSPQTNTCTCGCSVCCNGQDSATESTDEPSISANQGSQKPNTQTGNQTGNSSASVNMYSEKSVLENADFRILLTSDTHYTYRGDPYYETSKEDRMQMWVDAVNAEHARRPFDLIVIMGDVSLDHWKWQGGGSYLKDGISNTADFMRDYVSQLPSDVPVFVLAGNHEQYGNAKWNELVGNDRQGSFVLGDNLFLFLDSFADELDPDYHHDGVETAPDTDFIQAEMAKYPNHKVWLISHYFSLDLATPAFKAIVKDSRVKGLFQGHTHQNTIVSMGEEYGYKTIAQTGCFAAPSGTISKTNFWGFRDLVIVGDRATTRFIVAESDAVVDGVQTHFNRYLSEVKLY